MKTNINSNFEFNVIIPVAEAHLQQVIIGIEYIFENLKPRKIIIITNSKLKDLLPLSSKVEFLDEDAVFEEMTLQNIEKIIEELVGAKQRGGWYFQQFIKMAYAYACEDAHYLIWDADTIPLNSIEFFDNNKYFFTMKTEYHKPYFVTLEKLFNGKIKKYNQMSFISEQMIIDREVMIEVIDKIKNNVNLQGSSFFEKILYSINKNDLAYSGFSEFETYGNYAMTYYSSIYKLRYLRTFRSGARYLDSNLTRKDAQWISKDYDTISFEIWENNGRIISFIYNIFLKIKIVPFRYLVDIVSKIDNFRHFLQKV